MMSVSHRLQMQLLALGLGILVGKPDAREPYVLRDPFAVQSDTLGSPRNMKHPKVGCAEATRAPDI